MVDVREKARLQLGGRCVEREGTLVAGVVVAEVAAAGVAAERRLSSVCKKKDQSRWLGKTRRTVEKL